jgi:hypothetical protein
MIFVLLARADHPEGYGFPNGLGTATAHGYSLLVVACDEAVEMEEVKLRCTAGPIFFRITPTVIGLGQRQNLMTDEWYGGKFDFVGCVVGSCAFNRNGVGFGESSYGDNRYFGIVDAATIIDSLKEPEHPRYPDRWK